MTLTDDLLARAYMGATGKNLPPNQVNDARQFVLAVFNELTPAGYTDGLHFAEEEWELEGAVAIYRRPE